MREIEIKGIEFDSAGDAVQHMNGGGGAAVRVGGKNLVVAQAEADRLAEAGVGFAYLLDHHGRIVTVPVND